MIETLHGYTPQIGEGTFVAPTAVIIGDVVIGKNCTIWYGAVLRGDVNAIRIGDNVSVQDGCCLHTSPGTARIEIGSRITIGHNATIHGCTIHDHTLIGMGATILDDAEVNSDSIVAAGALVLGRTIIPRRELWGGVPAKHLRSLSAADLQRLVDPGIAGYDYWRQIYLAEHLGI